MAPADDNSNGENLPRSTTAVVKRNEQLKRWLESDTNKEQSLPKDKKQKVLFDKRVCFLAACAANDYEEINNLLSRGAADIDACQEDGMTSLHQACIDDRIDMVKFLVQRGADINRGDNEGWTPLHATASCGYLSIAKFLIENGARVDIVNNDGELPIDIADTDEMEHLLQTEIYKKGIDIELARNEEEQIMQKDIKAWYDGESVKENVHPKTGATPLHVAAAKGYQDIMRMLLELGVDLNARDADGWTPLHAAAHWGHREGCKMLVENGCDMEIKTNMGQTVIDLCEPDLISFMEDLQKRQPTLVKEKSAQMEQQGRRHPMPIKRRISANRGLNSDKGNIHAKEVALERAQMEAQRPSSLDVNTGSSSAPAAASAATPKAAEVTSVQTGVATAYQSPYTAVRPQQATKVVQEEAKLSEAYKPISFLQPTENKKPVSPPATRVPPPVAAEKPISFLPPPVDSKPISFLTPRESPFPLTSKLPASPLASPVDSTVKEKPKEPEKFTPLSYLRTEPPKEVPPPWSQKTAPATTEPAAAVIPKIVPVSHPVTQKVSSTTTASPKPVLPTLPSFEFIDESSAAQSPSAESPRSAEGRERPPRRMVPDWPPQPQSPNTEFAAKPLLLTTHTQPVPVPSARKVSPTTAEPPSPSTAPSNNNPAPPLSRAASNHFFGSPSSESGSVDPGTATVRRSFQPPSRDDESEAQRKAHAKRIRETRRSTQGVSAEDLKAADAQAKQSASTTSAPTTTATISFPPPSAQSSKPTSSVSRDEEKENLAAKSSASIGRLTIPTSNSHVATGVADSDSHTRLRPLTIPASPDAIITLPLRKSKSDEDADDPKNTRRRRPKRRSTGVVNIDMDEDEGTESASGTDLIDVTASTKQEEPSATQNGLLQAHRTNSNGAGSQNTPTSTERSYTRSRYNDASSDRTTPLSTSTTSTTPSYRTSRASSISSLSEKGETENTEQDWKKLYEQEKAENEKLKKKLQSAEKDLEDAKSIPSSGRTPADRSSEVEKRERRALERKLAEMEEELKELETLRADNQRLKEENGALIRVIRVQLDEIVINSKCPGTQFTSKVCDEAYVPAEEPLWSDGLIRPENAKGLFSPPFTATAPRTGTVPAGPDTVHYHTEYHYHAAKSRSGDASEAKDD
ncbi:Protein phosphatase 1 regulatory subunit 12A [Hypsibius exemplaris]|uniref:Protein phosphatase 1 regulatory subunit 12B n=1 Tax=Hypsibius exemplaris TaxID=2072580 RepID=A0A1W0WBM4_HYPEX|nr:Protein phosphatase 1 regulatory subunit 12A [Hypsibius exemplaris]